MRIIALETSSLHGSVAAASADELLHEIALPRTSRTAQSLAPALAELLQHVDWTPDSLDAIAVTVGPGSFTGLRIGVTTAKTLAWAAQARVIAVDTLHALAESVRHAGAQQSSVMPLINAHRNQLFAASYGLDSTDFPLAESEVELIDIDTWLAGPAPQACLTGPALPRLASEIAEHWPEATLCDESVSTPSAASVARIAMAKAQADHYVDTFDLMPKYYRPSYAEEKASK